MKYSLMELRCQLLLYLDKRRYLTAMKIECEKFLEQLTEKTICKFPPFRYLLEIDVMDLLDIYPDLGDFLIKEPLQYKRMCNEILFACVRSTNIDHNQNLERAQVTVTLRFKCIPRVLARPNTRSYGGLTYFEGLLTAVSPLLSYVYHSVWSCPEQCEGNEVILHDIPKTPPKCNVCRSVLFENSGLRRCGERVKATLILKKDLLSKTFTVADELIPSLKLGCRYILHAVIMRKSSVVWSLEDATPLKAPITTTILGDIEELYNDCKGIPWKFVYCLASSIGVNVCPLNCFMHLKISLLLSLTSVKAHTLTGSQIVHVLAAGFNTRYVGDLMAEAAKLADRHVFLGTANTTVATTLIGCSGGVCVMPLPLHAYDQRQTSSILFAIESGKISINASTTKLQCAIWAQGMNFKKIVLINVARVFGTVYRGDYGDYSEEIVDFMLQRAAERPKSSKEINVLKDVAVYIDVVAAIKVDLDSTTESLLRNYFLAARKKKPHYVSVGSFAALVAMCLTSARLCRRKIANIDDAVFAIWLHVSGIPEPRFAPDDFLQAPDDVKKIDKIINNFKDWLQEQFTI